MTSKEWFIEHKGKTLGPATSNQLKQFASRGKIQPTTKVRLGTDGDWILAGRVQGLFEIAKSPVPPTAPDSPAVPATQPPEPPTANRLIKSQQEVDPQDRTAVSNVAPVAHADSKLARFISDGQPPKTVGKLLSRVEGLCTDSETAEYVAVQHLPSIASPDAIVLTNHRVIVFRGKSLGRMNFVDVPWYDVQDIHISEGIIGASLIVRGMNGHQEKIDHLPKDQARSVYRVGQDREQQMREIRRQRKMEEERNAAGGVVVNNSIPVTSAPAPQPLETDLTARLQKLKSMLDAGLISQEEFDAKKADILAQL